MNDSNKRMTLPSWEKLSTRGDVAQVERENFYQESDVTDKVACGWV